jgi:hypothetical protein
MTHSIRGTSLGLHVNRRNKRILCTYRIINGRMWREAGAAYDALGRLEENLKIALEAAAALRSHLCI